MNLASVRIITDDLDRATAFYEAVTGLSGDQLAPVFVEFQTGKAALALGQTQTTALFDAQDILAAGQNRSVIIEFLVDDVDAEYERLQDVVTDWVQGPTTMPWGNRSILFHDPDGNLVNLFTPVGDQAKERFGG